MSTEIRGLNPVSMGVPAACEYHPCCKIVPSHIFEDLRLLNGVTVPGLQAHMGALPDNQPERKIEIQFTPQSLRSQRVHSAAQPTLIPSAVPKVPTAQPAAATPRVPNFPVYDLNGATDLEDDNGIPEYIKAVSEASKLAEPDNNWPSNAKRARTTARRVADFYKTNFARNSIDGHGMDIRVKRHAKVTPWRH